MVSDFLVFSPIPQEGLSNSSQELFKVLQQPGPFHGGCSSAVAQESSCQEVQAPSAWSLPVVPSVCRGHLPSYFKYSSYSWVGFSRVGNGWWWQGSWIPIHGAALPVFLLHLVQAPISRELGHHHAPSAEGTSTQGGQAACTGSPGLFLATQASDLECDLECVLWMTVALHGSFLESDQRIHLLQ